MCLVPREWLALAKVGPGTGSMLTDVRCSRSQADGEHDSHVYAPSGNEEPFHDPTVSPKSIDTDGDKPVNRRM